MFLIRVVGVTVRIVFFSFLCRGCERGSNYRMETAWPIFLTDLFVTLNNNKKNIMKNVSLEVITHRLTVHPHTLTGIGEEWGCYSRAHHISYYQHEISVFFLSAQ